MMTIDDIKTAITTERNSIFAAQDKKNDAKAGEINHRVWRQAEQHALIRKVAVNILGKDAKDFSKNLDQALATMSAGNASASRQAMAKDGLIPKEVKAMTDTYE